jgi:plasmid stability protein
MTLFTISAPEDIAEWIRQRAAESNRSTEQTISAVLKEAMERSISLSRREDDLFKALRQYGARPGIGVAAETLRFHWMMKVSETTSDEIAVAVDGLVKRGFVVTPESDEAPAIYLTNAGFERMKKFEQIKIPHAASAS